MQRASGSEAYIWLKSVMWRVCGRNCQPRPCPIQCHPGRTQVFPFLFLRVLKDKLVPCLLTVHSKLSSNTVSLVPSVNVSVLTRMTNLLSNCIFWMTKLSTYPVSSKFGIRPKFPSLDYGFFTEGIFLQDLWCGKYRDHSSVDTSWGCCTGCLCGLRGQSMCVCIPKQSCQESRCLGGYSSRLPSTQCVCKPLQSFQGF